MGTKKADKVMTIGQDSKVLVMCQMGQVRSVCCAMLLKSRGFKDVLVGGTSVMSLPTQRMLFDWADAIFIVGEEMLLYQISDDTKYNHKKIHVNIGFDIWGFPYHPDLIQKLQEYLKNIGL
jgi:hypothetical protein